MAYNADSIQILKPEEATDKFEWLKIEDLAAEFKVSRDFIERGFEACTRAEVSVEYFINKYLKKEATPRNDAVDYHSAQIQREMR